MTISNLIAYAGALFVAAAIPGPGMTAIVARALGSGFRETFLMGLGLTLGDLVYLTGAVLGLSFLAQSFATLFLIIKIIGALYLLFIAWKLWTAGLISERIEARPPAGGVSAFLSGLFVTLGNPKTMLFYLALLPTLIDLQAVTLRDYLALVVITFLTLLAVLLPYILLATRARLLLGKPSALKALNRSAAGVLGATAVYIAFRPA